MTKSDCSRPNVPIHPWCGMKFSRSGTESARRLRPMLRAHSPSGHCCGIHTVQVKMPICEESPVYRQAYYSAPFALCTSLFANMAALPASFRLSWRAGRRGRVRRRATELVHQLLDKVLGEGFIVIWPGQFCSLARMQGLVRVAAMPLILYFTMDTADSVVEARAAEDLWHACQSVCDLRDEVFVSIRTRSTM